MNFVSLMRDVLARIVAARESLECGNLAEASTILYEVEVDLAGGLSTIGDDVVRVRLSDFNTIPA